MAEIFTPAYTAIWDVIELNTTITGLVSLANRERFDEGHETRRKGLRSSLTPAAWPMISIELGGLETNFRMSNSSDKIVQTYDIILQTQSWRITQYGALKWELMKVGKTILPTLAGHQYVVRTQMMNIEETPVSDVVTSGGDHIRQMIIPIEVTFIVPGSVLDTPT